MTTELRLLSRVSFRGREITGPRVCGLLALLAAQPGVACGTGRLVEELWPDQRPEHPAKALQILVSRLRAQLGPDLVLRTPTGYRLGLVAGQVDAAAVLDGVAASAARAAGGDHSAALRHAEAALALWDGPPEPGGDGPLAELRAARATAHRDLRRLRALALARLGHAADALPELVRLAAELPRDEELLAELLGCEADTTGPAAALARYEDYRRTVRDELGTDPGPTLLAAHRRLLDGAAPPVRHGVPHAPNPLLGRDGDVAAVVGLLHSARVTSIVGPGGLGKTRLAHAVSRVVRLPAVHVVSLAGLHPDGDVADEVAAVLGVDRVQPGRAAVEPSTSGTVGGIAAALGPGPALLVLDNCEHVLARAAEMVRMLVAVAGELRVLTTSRAPLGLSSESVYPLPELDPATTAELFTQRARAARPGVELPPAAVAEVCGYLDGLPLAVELAAARVRVMSVAEIARRLTDRFTLLRGGARDAPARHRTMHAVVEWSWNLLDADARSAMRALSVLPGGCTAATARFLLADDHTGDDAEGVLDTLTNLVDHSLLKVVDTPAGTRFRMLETVREFAAAARAEAGETGRVLDRFLVWGREFGLAHHESLVGRHPAEPGRLVAAEQDNLVAALRAALDAGEGATVVAAGAALAALWTVDMNFSRMDALLRDTAHTLSHHRPGPELVEATRTLATLSTAYEFSVAGPGATRALVALRRLPPVPPTTLVRAMGAVLCAGPDVPALADSEAPLLAGLANGVVSYLLENAGDTRGALAAATRGHELIESQGLPWASLLGHGRLAELYLHGERGAEGAHHLRAALRILEDLGARPNRVKIGWALAVAALQQGDLADAERWLGRAGAGEGLDSWGTRTFDLAVRAEVLLARGEVDAGLATWRHALREMTDGADGTRRDEPGAEPWTLEIEAVTVVAHAQHGRLDLVADVVAELPATLVGLLTGRGLDQPAFLTTLPLPGALLLALGLADLEAGATWSGVRLVALAEHFRFLRQFQPTMSAARARARAEQADRDGYARAAVAHAGLGPDELRAAALALLAERAGADAGTRPRVSWPRPAGSAQPA